MTIYAEQDRAADPDIDPSAPTYTLTLGMSLTRAEVVRLARAHVGDAAFEFGFPQLLDAARGFIERAISRAVAEIDDEGPR